MTAANRPRLVAPRKRASAARDGAEPAALGQVLDSIRAIVRILRVSGRASEQVLGVNGAQLFVLQKLAESPAQSLADLAERTHTDPSSVSVVVSRLVARGLVTREASEYDARRVNIALTAPGRAIVRRAPRAAQTRIVEAAAQLPARRLRDLAAGLAELVERMDGAGEDERRSTDGGSPRRARPRARGSRR
jgi:DNA-binding MarR family transcriptional regulator